MSDHLERDGSRCPPQPGVKFTSASKAGRHGPTRIPRAFFAAHRRRWHRLRSGAATVVAATEKGEPRSRPAWRQGCFGGARAPLAQRSLKRTWGGRRPERTPCTRRCRWRCPLNAVGCCLQNFAPHVHGPPAAPASRRRLAALHARTARGRAKNRLGFGGAASLESTPVAVSRFAFNPLSPSRCK